MQRTGIHDPVTFLESYVKNTEFDKDESVNPTLLWRILLINVTRVIVCCTWGAQGAIAARLHTRTRLAEWTSCSAWKSHNPSAQVVDTVGAGDTFIAAMLFSLANHNCMLEQQLRYAVEAAGRKVLQSGLDGLGAVMKDKAISPPEVSGWALSADGLGPKYKTIRAQLLPY